MSMNMNIYELITNIVAFVLYFTYIHSHLTFFCNMKRLDQVTIIIIEKSSFDPQELLTVNIKNPTTDGKFHISFYFA